MTGWPRWADGDKLKADEALVLGEGQAPRAIAKAGVFDLQSLVSKLIEHHLGEEPVAVRPIPTGKFNDSFFVSLPGRELVARIAPPDDAVFCFYEYRMMRQEPEIHRLLAERTGVPVAEILVADFSRNLIDRDFLVMERLEGAPLTEQPLPAGAADCVLEQVGRYLRAAHEVTGDAYGYVGAHRPMKPARCWAEAFETMWHKLIDDVVAVGEYDADEQAMMRRLHQASRSHFEHDTPARLLHMDIWHQNIMVDPTGRVTGLIDWDRALWGDPEIEFAVLDYCGVSERAFWAGYGTGDDPRAGNESAQVRRLLYLLYEMQKYIVIRKGRNGNPSAARAAKAACLELASQAIS
jgi:aminoglycoside phosphotransferase (APT) family kinase protein